MISEIFTTRRILTIALASLASLANNAAFAWGDDAINAWTTRNAALVAAVNQSVDAAAPPDATGQTVLYVVDSRGFFYKQNAEEKAATDASGNYVVQIGEHCDGLTGEHIKNGGRNMPVWAQTAQQRFCSGVKAMEHALVDKPSDKKRCKDLASAIDYASKASPGDDPEAIVQSAAALSAAAEKLRNIPIVMTQKSKLLGDSQRTFRCD